MAHMRWEMGEVGAVGSGGQNQEGRGDSQASSLGSGLGDSWDQVRCWVRSSLGSLKFAPETCRALTGQLCLQGAASQPRSWWELRF